MMASSFFSLLNPAIDLSFKQNQISWIVVSIGFLLGGLLIILADLLLNKILKDNNYLVLANFLYY